MSRQDENELHLEKLIKKMSAAVRLKDVEKITHKIKDDLEEIIRAGGIKLPASYITPNTECYARRLVHQDPDLGYVMVAMTWGPGQATPIHDHDGIWCVEGVVSGEMNVTQYEILEKKKDLYKFEVVGRVRAGVGGAGALIPPHEHHLLANAYADRPSVTLHVYGGEITKCSAFVEEKDGWFRREIRQLTYHD